MNNIRKYRELKGLTQRDFAKLIGISQPQLCRLENGQRKLSHKILNKVANILKVNPWNILNIYQPIYQKKGVSIMGKIINMLFAPFKWVALGIRGGLAFILRSCFGCMVVYPKVKGKKNGK